MNNQNKVIIIGDTLTGKTCLLIRQRDGIFFDSQPITVGINYEKIEVNINGANVVLHVYDTAGQERYQTFTREFWQDAVVAIICFCPLNPKFTEVFKYQERLQEQCPNCKIIYCATKCDLYDDPNFPTSDYESVRKAILIDEEENGSSFYETSSLKGINVSQVFHRAGEICLENQQYIRTHNSNCVDISKSASTEKKSCC